jgi:hypothetical protein
MSLSNVKAYVLTAASSSLTDLVSALYAHFNSAPGLWRLKSGAGSSAAGMVVEPKTPITEAGFTFNLGVSIRRNGTTNFQLALDPLNSYSAAGNAAGGPTGGSVQASGDITLAITNIANAKIALVETQDALLCLFFNSGLTQSPQAFHIGRVFDVIRETYRLAPLLNNGLAVLAGLPGQNSNSQWGCSMTGASRIRHNGGWRPLNIIAQGNNNEIPDAPSANKETIVPMICDAFNAASTLPMRILVARYLGIAASARAGRTLLESTTEDEAWMHVVDGNFNLSAAVNVVIWEKGTAKPS